MRCLEVADGMLKLAADMYATGGIADEQDRVNIAMAMAALGQVHALLALVEATERCVPVPLDPVVGNGSGVPIGMWGVTDDRNDS